MFFKAQSVLIYIAYIEDDLSSFSRDGQYFIVLCILWE